MIRKGQVPEIARQSLDGQARVTAAILQVG
jgi:hypothetical protein